MIKIAMMTIIAMGISIMLILADTDENKHNDDTCHNYDNNDDDTIDA